MTWRPLWHVTLPVVPQAREFVVEQNKQRQFTDTGSFTLRGLLELGRMSQ